jgi:hypothetical protein
MTICFLTLTDPKRDKVNLICLYYAPIIHQKGVKVNGTQDNQSSGKCILSGTIASSEVQRKVADQSRSVRGDTRSYGRQHKEIRDFENLEHRREFEKWHLSKYGTEYQWKGGNKKAANDAATP